MTAPSLIEIAVRSALTDTFGRIVVAFSGGLDSSVLLRAVVESVDDRRRVLALHVNHGLNPRADEWQRHCKTVSDELGIAHTEVRVEVGSHDSPEAAARNARYAAFREFLVTGDVLWLAHHRDDQAETLLWKLMRGGGVAALAGMPQSRPLGAGYLRRPLLDVSRADIAAWAEARGLRWVDDASNADARFDRNFIRRDIMPVLGRRWPDAAQRLQHAARRFADEAVLLRAELDRRLGELGADTARIPVSVARDPQALPLLRRWLDRAGIIGIRERVLIEIARQAGGAIDRAPQVQVAAGFSVRRFEQRLYLVSDPRSEFATTTLRLGEELATPAGRLISERGDGGGLRSDVEIVEVRARRGGESLRPAGRGGSRTVKRLLQEARIPLWLRSTYPLIYIDDRLAAVPGVAVDTAFAQVAEGTWQLKVVTGHSDER